MKVYGSANSYYFFAKGILYRFQTAKDGIIWAMSPALYVAPADIMAALSAQHISLKGNNDPGKLEKFVEALRPKEMSKEKREGRFVGPGMGASKGRVLYSTEIIKSADVPEEKLAPLLRKYASKVKAI